MKHFLPLRAAWLTRLIPVFACAILCCFGSLLHAQTIVTVAGNGGTGFTADGIQATTSALGHPTGISFDNAGNLYITDPDNMRIRKVSPAGIISTIAGNSGFIGYSGDGGPATNAQFYHIADVAVNRATGNVYICDYWNRRVRIVNTAGIITTVAGSAGTDLFSGDGGPATNATLYRPLAVTVDAAGNLYIADDENYRVRKVNTAGIISTVAGNGTMSAAGDGGPATAASLHYPTDVAVDAAGNLYICDGISHTVRKVNTAGIISTVAGRPYVQGYSGDGGPATNATLHQPLGIAVDAAGSLFISDADNSVIRKVDPSGMITTYAGDGVAGFTGDGGPALSARFYGAQKVELDNSGAVHIADHMNNRVRKVFPFVHITISPNDTVCPGTSVTFTATVTNGCSANTYQWFVNGIAAGTGASTFTYLPADGDKVYCYITSGGAPCTSPLAASSNTITVTVWPKIISIGPARVCVNRTTTLTGIPAAGSWTSASPAVATVNIVGVVTGISTGTAIITYTIAAGCFTTVTVTVNATPNPGSISGPGSVCVGKAITLLNTVPGGNWSGGGAVATVDAAGVVTGLTPGTTSITYTVNNGTCAGLLARLVTVNALPPAAAISGLGYVCPGATFTLGSTLPGGRWGSSNTGTATIDSVSGTVTSKGLGTSVITYTTSADANGCRNTSTFTVNVATADFTISAAVTHASCYGDSSGSITLSPTPADSVYTYSWTTGATGATATGLAAGSYTVLATQAATQCKLDTAFTITQPDSMSADITVKYPVCRDSGWLKAEVTGGVPGYEYVWKHYANTLTGPQVTIPPQHNGWDTLIVTDANGCQRRWVQFIMFTNCNTVTIFRGISPNGDGINDKWIVGGLNDYPLNTVQVFDKWGDLVYEKANYDNTWEGTKSGGSPLPDGVYYFLVKLGEPSKTGGEDAFTGTLTINR